MKKSEQALMPDFFQPAVKEATKIIKKPQKGDDDLLLGMGESDGWDHLQDLVNGIINKLEDNTRIRAGNAKTLEELGLIYLIRDLSKDSMEAVLNIVNLRVNAKLAEPKKE